MEVAFNRICQAATAAQLRQVRVAIRAVTGAGWRIATAIAAFEDARIKRADFQAEFGTTLTARYSLRRTIDDNVALRALMAINNHEV